MSSLFVCSINFLKFLGYIDVCFCEKKTENCVASHGCTLIGPQLPWRPRGRTWPQLLAGLAVTSGQAHRGEFWGVRPSSSLVRQESEILNPVRRSTGWQRCRKASTASRMAACWPLATGMKIGPVQSQDSPPLHETELAFVAHCILRWFASRKTITCLRPNIE